ncbi:MAG: hypothetical protein EA362_11225 [Saprospirales bacterium]|nr:MAG: hypothetical protein EA362_11225 [Saprospirales bacterium]
MDSTAQIKKSLISRIKNTNDIDFLKALQTIFDSSEKAFFKLSPEQEKSIEEGRAQINVGKSSSNDEVVTEIKEWLAKQ